MDFLDPRKKRAHSVRLVIGYFLVAIAIFVGTTILVYGAYGYSINTKTGDIVENGLLFVDSKPGGADIYLNDKPINSTTAARLILPSGNYTLNLKREGYRTWERKFQLEEHAIARYIYPFLFPNKPVSTNIKNYSSMPPLITESPDRRWLLVQVPVTDAKAITFDEYDTGDPKKAEQTLTMPATLLSAPAGTLAEVEWSTDNKNLLLEHTYTGGKEFIIFNRDSPADSINVNKLFSINPTQVALRDKKINRLYLYNQTSGNLQLADTSRGTVEPPFLRRVLAFKPYGNNIVNYVTDIGAPAGKVVAKVWDKEKSYPLYTFSAGTKYVVDMAEFQGHAYFVAGSDTSDRINLYKDPLRSLRSPAIGKATPMIALRAEGASSISFSNNARFVVVQGGQNFAVYDFETKERYEYKVDTTLSAPMEWMDGHRLMSSSEGKILIMDYDSTNKQLLAPTNFNLGGYFSRNYNLLFTTVASEDGSSVILEHLDMRAGEDLPKTN